MTVVVTVLVLFIGYFCPASAQTLVPGIHGMSIVPDVKFTWVIISSDNEVSINLRYIGQNTSPPITVIATALTNQSQSGGAASTTGGSQVLNAGWTTPNSLTIKIDGTSSLYDADLITVVASPYGSTSQPNPPLETTNNQTTSSPPSTTTNEPIQSQPQTFIPSEQSSEPSSSSSSNSDNEPKSNNKNNCDPSYPDFCIPPPPPDLNCADIGKKRFTVQGADPHGFDRDNDGVGCES